MSMQSLGFAAQKRRGPGSRGIPKTLRSPGALACGGGHGMGGHEVVVKSPAPWPLDTLRQSVVASGSLESSIHAAHQAILAAVQEEGRHMEQEPWSPCVFVDADYEAAWDRRQPRLPQP